MQIDEVVAVLADLRAAGCRFSVAGGWGVDTLVGRQTRSHRDLDLVLHAADETTALQALSRRGYRVATDWRPVRVELAAAGVGFVDLHPVVFDATGHGRQADRGGAHFDYPLDAFDEGVLAGIAVPCLSRRQQLSFRSGYLLRAVDRHDIALLEM